MTDDRSSRELLKIELRLPNVDALFEPPHLTPFSPEFQPYSYQSGIEYLADRLYANRRLKSVEATFVLPPDELSATTHAEVEDAIGRYTASRIEALEINVRADSFIGLRALLIGFVAAVVLLMVAGVVEESTGDGFVAETIVFGIRTAAWVAVWFPLDRVFWGTSANRRNRHDYERLRDMRFALATDGDHR